MGASAGSCQDVAGLVLPPFTFGFLLMLSDAQQLQAGLKLISVKESELLQWSSAASLTLVQLWHQWARYWESDPNIKLTAADEFCLFFCWMFLVPFYFLEHVWTRTFTQRASQDAENSGFCSLLLSQLKFQTLEGIFVIKDVERIFSNFAF